MMIPLSYIYRSLWTRRLTTSLTVLGLALVVFVFAAVLMLANGLKEALVATGSDDNAIVLRKSAESETLSSISLEEADIITTLPEIAVGADGKPLITKEVLTMINRRMKGAGEHDFHNVIVRGVSPAGLTLRPQVKIKDGRMFTFGSSEIVVGSQISDRFEDMTIGKTVSFAGRSWTIVGILDAGRTGFASDIWGDKDQILQAFNRQAFSSMVVKLKNPEAFEALKAKIAGDPRTNGLKILHEKEFYEAESEALGTFIKVLGLVVTILFSFGAMIGAMITMYAAVANRTVEIGTLRALGFQRISVLLAFLIESLFISLLGGAIGLLVASLMSLVTISTTNFTTWSEMAFGFSLNFGIVIGTAIFALSMGLIGGFLPSIRASRLNIISALRSS